MQLCATGHAYDPQHYHRCPECGIAELRIETAGIGEATTQIDPLPVPDPPQQPPNAQSEAAVDTGEATKVFDISSVPHHPGIGIAGGGNAEPAVDPVVGWLVVRSGPDKGRDYRLVSEGNFIGRAATHQIVLSDPTVADREPHAIVYFDPASADAAYYVQPGGRHIVYRNGAPVFAATRLEAFDTLRIGHTELLFVPLCSERFNWRDNGRAAVQ